MIVCPAASSFLTADSRALDAGGYNGWTGSSAWTPTVSLSLAVVALHGMAMAEES